MATYMLVYRVPQGGQPDASPEVAQAWQSFLDIVGSNMLDAGNPVFNRRVIGTSTAGTVLGGYSVIEAADFDTAVKLASGVPFLAVGGAVEIGELTRLNPEDISTTAQDHARSTELDH